MVKEVIEDRISKIKLNKNELTTLSFFSGALGLDIGLEKEGYNIVLACEFDKACRNTIMQIPVILTTQFQFKVTT